jgi:hypothetical protein
MKCPHCLVAFYGELQYVFVGNDVDGGWGVQVSKCPSCERLIIELVRGEWATSPGMPRLLCPAALTLVHPKSTSRAPLSPEIPAKLVQDYREACLVLPDSPKASAALSRRCLQYLLHDRAGVKRGDLAVEIQQVLDSKQLPSYLANAIDAVRNIGNFAAHPSKSNNSGEIVDVEPGEAEWNLDTLEGLFDFYFVQPAKLREKRDKLNQKLKDMGKPDMK